MFFHVLRYRMLAYIRDRETVFWSLLFPLILTSVLSLVMSGLTNEEIVIAPAKAAVVQTDHYAAQTPLQEAIRALNADQEAPFEFTLVATPEEAKEQLIQGDIDGYFIPQDDYALDLHVTKSGMWQTMLEEFQITYSSNARMIVNIMETNPIKGMSLLLSGLPESRLQFEKIDPDQNVTNPWGSMYFAQIALIALYASLQAVTEGSAVDPSIYPVGLRQRMTPQHHLGIVLSSFFAVFFMSLFNVGVYLVFSQFVLGLDFGLTTYPLYAIGISVAGIMCGIALGFLVSAWIPGKRNRHNVAIAISMFMVFFAGMMQMHVRQIVRTFIPFIKYINPADMITDGFYALMYYGDKTRALMNIGLLVTFAAVCLVFTFIRIRRTRYDHL